MPSSLKIAVVVALGLPLLLLPCLFRRWTQANYPSIKPWPSGTENVGPHRPLIDEWRCNWLNRWYANSEDGVSGQQAWIWDASGKLVTYASTFPAWVPQCVIAFAWSVWRNNANNYKRPLRTDSLNKPWLDSPALDL